MQSSYQCLDLSRTPRMIQYKAKIMINVKRREGEHFEKMLKRYKRKHKDFRVLQEVKKRMYYVKPSERRKSVLEQAKYTNRKQLAGEF